MPRRRRNAPDVEVVTIPCDFTGCVHQATHHPKVCVPMKGWSVDSHKPCGAVFGMKLCKEHAHAFDVQALLLIRTNRQIFMEISQQNMQTPDFGRAFVVAVPIKPVPERQPMTLRRRVRLTKRISDQWEEEYA